MRLHTRRGRRLPAPAVMVVALLGVAGLLVDTPSAVQATVTPTLTVSPTSGPVGSVVTVQFGPAADGCGGPVFEPAAGPGEGLQILPFIGPPGGVEGESGAQDFVVPSVLSTPSHTNAPVSLGSYQFVLTCDTSNIPASAVSVSVPFTVTGGVPSRFVGIASTKDGKGYWLAQAAGGVFSYGDAPFYGSPPGVGITPTDQIVGIVATPDGEGYWLVGADGGVFGFGDAHFWGSMGGQPPDQPVIGMATTPDGNGYWEVGSDGTVYSFGDAHSFGAFGQPFDMPTVGIGSSSDGNGYWAVESDGGVFSYGDAQFHGSVGGQHLNRPIVAIGVDRATGGYWEVAADGGIFALAAPYLGSTGSSILNQPITGIVSTPTGLGYHLVAADGGVFSFGDAQFYGSAA